MDEDQTVTEWIGCDGPRCPARALVHVSKFDHNDVELHYCGHHGNEYMEKLKAWGIVTDDRLTGKVVATIPAETGAFV